MDKKIINPQSETENIINTLEKLDDVKMSENKEKNENNKTMCRLLNIHLREFFNDIYVPYDFFRDENWNISEVLRNNKDILFYNKKYLTEEDEERFNEVFNKYINALEEIFSIDNKLFIFLKNWTDMRDTRWKTNGSKSYLKSLLVDRKYEYISPIYTTNIFLQMSKKYQNDTDKIKLKVENHLNEIVKNVKKEVKAFKKIYNEIITSYVFEYPPDTDEKDVYVLGFINSIIMSILDFAEKLISLNVYAIHAIVTELIVYYTPLDEINQYNPSENHNRKIYIV
jgi:hypothetical protein